MAKRQQPKKTPADIVIERFGGCRAVARVLDVDHSWVVRWRKPKREGGTAGLVPVSHQRVLLEEAEKRGIELTAVELVVGAA